MLLSPNRDGTFAQKLIKKILIKNGQVDKNIFLSIFTQLRWSLIRKVKPLGRVIE